jgi:nucleoside phosphorylase
MRTVREGQYTSTPRKAILAAGPRRFPLGSAPDCLVVSAWPPEVEHLRQAMRRRSTQATLALASVGVGLVEAALGAGQILETLRPRTVILVGTAGVYPSSADRFPVGTAAVADAIALAPEILPGDDTYLPEVMPRVERATAALAKAIRKASGLPSARVANPLAISASRRAAACAARRSGCNLENLEAFALARAAASMGIPFAAVLGIANKVGPNAHAEWKKNAATAAAAACEAVMSFLRFV